MDSPPLNLTLRQYINVDCPNSLGTCCLKKSWAKIWPVSLPVALATACSKVDNQLLLYIICCCSGCLWFFLRVWSLYSNAVLRVLSSFAIILLRKRAGCFTLIVMWLLVFCASDLRWGLPVVCDCGIFWSY